MPDPLNASSWFSLRLALRRPRAALSLLLSDRDGLGESWPAGGLLFGGIVAVGLWRIGAWRAGAVVMVLGGIGYYLEAGFRYCQFRWSHRLPAAWRWRLCLLSGVDALRLAGLRSSQRRILVARFAYAHALARTRLNPRPLVRLLCDLDRRRARAVLLDRPEAGRGRLEVGRGLLAAAAAGDIPLARLYLRHSGPGTPAMVASRLGMSEGEFRRVRGWIDSVVTYCWWGLRWPEPKFHDFVDDAKPS